MDRETQQIAEAALIRRSGRRILAAALLALGLVWGGTAVFVLRGRVAAVEATYAWAEAQAATASETLLRAFEGVNAVHDLVHMRQDMLRTGDTVGAAAVEAHLTRIATERRLGIVQVGVIGPDGVLTWGSAPGGVGTSLADRAHFRIHAEGGERGLAISRPLVGRTTGRWSVQATRPLLTPEGRFDGVVVVSVDPIALSRTLQGQFAGAGRLIVVRRLADGSLVSRSRDAEAHLDRGPREDHPAVMAARHAAAGRIAYHSTLDNRPLLGAFRVPQGLPLSVTVVCDETEGVRGWVAQRNVAAILALALSLLVAALASIAFSFRRLRLEQQRSGRERIEAAEALARQRAEILAVMAHEIRTPLTGVLGFGELLAAAPLPPEQHRHAELVVETGRVLMAVVNDILDLAKLEAGRVSIETQPFRLREMLGQALSLCEAGARQKGLRIALELEPELPGWLLGDATRLRQVLGNFLSNAVKFTESGSILLRASSSGGRLRLEVTDSGIGIPPAAQERLFLMFEQLEGGRRLGGTGLGLAICRRLIEAMGGSIGVDSTPGQGSTFWCELPLRPAPEPEKASPAQAQEAGPPLTVLVADDVAANRALIRAYLAGSGHSVELATDGIEAVAAAERQAFDVIVLDVNMPGLDGTEVTRRLRLGRGPNAATPVIALTASTSREERERVQQAGMTLHLAKPVTRAVLLRALQQVALPVA